MNEMNDDKIREMLKKAMAPAPTTELQQDLWPRMLRKLDERSVHGHWLDWVLLALAAAWCLVFPSAIPALAYYF